MMGVLPPGASVSIPGAPAEAAATAVVSSAPDPAVRESTNDKVSNPTESGTALSGSAVVLPPITSLPTNVTGQDLLTLQAELAVLEKKKQIASGEEAIAESQLKTRKAQYEMAQIGRPLVAQPTVQQAPQQHAAVATAKPAPPPSPLTSVRLLSTARASGSIEATINYNGKLIDVKKGSVVAGYLIDKVTDKSLTFVGEHETKTVWID